MRRYLPVAPHPHSQYLSLNGEEVGKLVWLQSWPRVGSYDVEDGDEQESLRWDSPFTLAVLFLICSEFRMQKYLY